MTDDAVKLPVDVSCILHLLPHRYPFLLVDRVIELEPHRRVRAIKNVTFNEPFFQGHFPGRPVMPGVLVIEAMAQAGGLLTQLSLKPGEKPESAAPKFSVYSGMDLPYWQEFYLLGEAEAVAERIRGKIEALGGVDHLILNPLDWDPASIEVLAERVLPLVAAP